MSISLLLFTSILSSMALLTTLFRLSDKWTKRMLGYEVYVDAIAGILIAVYFGMSGSALAMLTGIVTSLFFGLVLYVAKHLLGWSKYENGQWVEYKGDLTIGAIVRWFSSLGGKMKVAAAELKQPKEVTA